MITEMSPRSRVTAMVHSNCEVCSAYVSMISKRLGDVMRPDTPLPPCDSGAGDCAHYDYNYNYCYGGGARGAHAWDGWLDGIGNADAGHEAIDTYNRMDVDDLCASLRSHVENTGGAKDVPVLVSVCADGLESLSKIATTTTVGVRGDVEGRGMGKKLKRMQTHEGLLPAEGNYGQVFLSEGVHPECKPMAFKILKDEHAELKTKRDDSTVVVGKWGVTRRKLAVTTMPPFSSQCTDNNNGDAAKCELGSLEHEYAVCRQLLANNAHLARCTACTGILTLCQHDPKAKPFGVYTLGNAFANKHVTRALCMPAMGMPMDLVASYLSGHMTQVGAPESRVNAAYGVRLIVFRAALSLLNNMHSMRWIHGDFKLDNLMTTDEWFQGERCGSRGIELMHMVSLLGDDESGFGEICRHFHGNMRLIDMGLAQKIGTPSAVFDSEPIGNKPPCISDTFMRLIHHGSTATASRFVSKRAHAKALGIAHPYMDWVSAVSIGLELVNTNLRFKRLWSQLGSAYTKRSAYDWHTSWLSQVMELITQVREDTNPADRSQYRDLLLDEIERLARHAVSSYSQVVADAERVEASAATTTYTTTTTTTTYRVTGGGGGGGGGGIGSGGNGVAKTRGAFVCGNNNNNGDGGGDACKRRKVWHAPSEAAAVAAAPLERDVLPFRRP